MNCPIKIHRRSTLFCCIVLYSYILVAFLTIWLYVCLTSTSGLNEKKKRPKHGSKIGRSLLNLPNFDPRMAALGGETLVAGFSSGDPNSKAPFRLPDCCGSRIPMARICRWVISIPRSAHLN